jgi:hypothetical protein
MARDKIFVNDESTALSDSQAHTPLFSIAYECPYTHSDRACGNWCPLFEMNETQSIRTNADGVNETTFKQSVGLRCGDGKKKFQYTSDAPVDPSTPVP